MDGRNRLRKDGGDGRSGKRISWEITPISFGSDGVIEIIDSREGGRGEKPVVGGVAIAWCLKGGDETDEKRLQSV